MPYHGMNDFLHIRVLRINIPSHFAFKSSLMNVVLVQFMISKFRIDAFFSWIEGVQDALDSTIKIPISLFFLHSPCSWTCPRFIGVLKVSLRRIEPLCIATPITNPPCSGYRNQHIPKLIAYQGWCILNKMYTQMIAQSIGVLIF